MFIIVFNTSRCIFESRLGMKCLFAKERKQLRMSLLVRLYSLSFVFDCSCLEYGV